MTENLILFCYANGIIAAIERKYYPQLPQVVGPAWGDAVRSGVRLVFWLVVGNLLCVPCYLFMPGANLILFLLMNGYVLGRGYFDAVTLRRADDFVARTLWRSHRVEFVLLGALSMILLTVPLLNLFVPIIGLATAVHLLQRRILETSVGKIRGNA